MSALEQLHTFLKEKIATINDIKSTGRWNNQPINEEGEIAFNHPGCFFGYSEIIWQDQAAGVQKGTVTITAYLVFESLDLGDDEQDNLIFPLAQKVTLAIHGTSFVSTDNLISTSAIKRLEEREDQDHDNVLVWEIDFQTEITDCSVGRQAKLQEVTPDYIIDRDESILDIDDDNIRTGDGDFS